MADKNKETVNISDAQFQQLLNRIGKNQQQKGKFSQSIGNLLKGSATAANKLISVGGKKMSLEGKIVRKDLYFGQDMTKLVNPLGIEIEKPMDLYKVPRQPIAASQSQLRQKLNFFGVTKLRLY